MLGPDSVTTRNHLGEFEKEWFRSAMNGDIKDIKAKYKSKPNLLEHKDYILGVRKIYKKKHFIELNV